MKFRVRSQASLSGLKIWCCCELWYRPAAVALIRPLAWGPPYAMGCSPKKQKEKKERKNCKLIQHLLYNIQETKFHRVEITNLRSNLSPNTTILQIPKDIVDRETDHLLEILSKCLSLKSCTSHLP